MINHLQQIKDLLYIQAKIQLPDEYIEQFATTVQHVKVKRFEQIIRMGEQVNQFVYVIQGLVRLYHIDKKGKEYTKNFKCTGELCGVLAAILTGEPSILSMEALVDSELLVVDFNAFRELADNDVTGQKIFNYLLTSAYLEKENRESELMFYDAPTRYQHFLAQFPEWNRVIPRKYIASYLAMSAETLSRIEKNQS